MKKLFLSFLLLFSAGAMAEVCLHGRSTALDSTGTLVPGTKEKCYINVVNGSGAAIADGAPVTWDVGDDNGYSVDVTTTQGLAGACVMDEACADSSTKVCRCQTYGYKSAVLFDSTNGNSVAGGPIYFSASNSGYAQATVSSVVGSSASRLGSFLDVASSSGSVEAFISTR